jgi:drug/metabolite transporter (DMT)-like permease
VSAGTEAGARPASRADLVGVALVGLGAIAFSGKAIIVKLGLHLGADAVTLLALRMLVALPLFLLMGIWAARRAAPLSTGDRWRVFALGVSGYYLASLFDFLGLAYISATLERVILYLTPTFVLLMGAVLARRRPTRVQLVALAISYAGVALAFGHDLRVGGEGVLVGSVLVLCSALSYAVYLYGSGEIVARVGAVRLTAYASTVAAVLCIGQYLVIEPWGLPRLPHAVYALSLLNGTLCTVAPVLMTMLGVRRLGSGVASQIGMIGPVSTIVLSQLILHEPMGPWQIAGTGLVVAGVLAVSRAKAG